MLTSNLSIEEQIAENLAKIIINELYVTDLPQGRYKKRLVEELYTEIPARTGLSYPTRSGVAVPRKELSSALSNQLSDEEAQRLFCLAHGEFVLCSGMDIEHAYPYKLIREKQKKLFAYLNDPSHQQLVEAFLKQADINLYIRRDKKDNQIKGSGYFFHLCYNAIDNLLLLCHACNLDKSSQNPLDWFKAQETYFGQSFINDVEAAGGLQEGVLLNRIYLTSANNLRLELSADEKIELPAEETQGLGEFARKWFFKRFTAIFEQHRDFYNQHFIPLKNHLSILQRFINQGAWSKAMKAHTRLQGEMKMLAQIQKELVGATIEITSTGSSDSSEDAQGQEEGRQDILATTLNAHLTKYIFDKIRKLIKNVYHDKKLGSVIRTYCRSLNKPPLPSDDWEAVYTELEEEIGIQVEKGDEPEPKKYIKEKIESLFNKYSPLAQEKAKRLQEKAERLQEREARLKSEAELEQATAKIRALEQIIGSNQLTETTSFFSQKRVYHNAGTSSFFSDSDEDRKDETFNKRRRKK